MLNFSVQKAPIPLSFLLSCVSNIIYFCVSNLQSLFAFLSIIQWNLTCSRSHLSNLSQSAFFLGSLLGAWIWGSAADRFGRRKIFFLTTALMSIFGMLTALSFSYYSFIFFRLCTATSGAGALLSLYVLGIELVGKSGRNFAGMAGMVIFALSYPVLAIMAYFIRSWRWLTLLISAGSLVAFTLIR